MRWLLLAAALYGGYTVYQGGFRPAAGDLGGATLAPRAADAGAPEPRAADRAEPYAGRKSTTEMTRERVLKGASRR
jgi:hypothetical protein